MIALNEPCTAYDVKRQLEFMARGFWSVPHTQVYRESARLAREGLIEGRQEEGGRRRRIYTMTPEGSARVREWTRAPTERSIEIHDLAQLKLVASELSTTSDVRTLAEGQAEQYRRRLAELDRIEEVFSRRPDRRLRAQNLELGRAVYGAALEFWTRLAEDPPEIMPG